MAKREDPKEAPLAAAAKEVKEKMKGLGELVFLYY